MAFERITTDPDVLGGVPCIRGLRVPVTTVVGMVADGMTVEEILLDLPRLDAEDVSEALRYTEAALEHGRLVRDAISSLSAVVNAPGLITSAEDREELHVAIGLLADYADE
jgi:uncharacterized protein (DUF433 family)